MTAKAVLTELTESNLHIDAELVNRCLKNDQKAQKELFDTHAKQMLALCYRYVEDYDTAHDLMQEGFIKVFQKLESYSQTSPVKAWIKKIMVNHCLAWLRKEKRVQKTDLDMATEIADHVEPFADFLEINQIFKAISKLPQQMRIVINLFAIEGYTYEEIASELEIEETSVRSQVSRARKLLLEMIKSGVVYDR